MSSPELSPACGIPGTLHSIAAVKQVCDEVLRADRAPDET
jgi:hypothetical protein